MSYQPSATKNKAMPMEEHREKCLHYRPSIIITMIYEYEIYIQYSDNLYCI